MTGRILFASSTDNKLGPLAFVIMRDLVSTSGLEGRVRIDSAGLPGMVGERVPRVIVRQAKNILGFHEGLTLQKYRSQAITDDLLRRQDLVIVLNGESASTVRHMVGALHPVVQPNIKEKSDYGMAGLTDPKEGTGSWSELILRMREALDYHFWIIMKDAGL